MISASAENSPLDVISVPAFGPKDNGSFAYSSIVLEKCVEYRIVVSGTYQFKIGTDWGYADAQYRMGAGHEYTQQFNSIEIDGELVDTDLSDIDNHTYTFFWIGTGDKVKFSIYDTYITGERGDYDNNAGSLEVEIYQLPTLSITKSSSPQYTEQGQATTITITLTNTGTSDIKDITVSDSIPDYFSLLNGELEKKYDLLRPQDSRNFQYIIQPIESGTFNLEPASASYNDLNGNNHTTQSNLTTLYVTPSTKPIITPTKISNASVQLHGEKTDVKLGEDILLKLSAVNLITKPVMHVQVIILAPSGMSVTSSEFVQSGAGQFTTTYELEPGKGRDIEIRIMSNQIGEFQVEGRIVYYFNEDREHSEDHTLTLPIRVKESPIQTTPTVTPTPTNSDVNVKWIIIGLFAILGLLVFLKFKKL